MKAAEQFQLWIDHACESDEIKQELLLIQHNPREIADRFYSELAFGTGGLRGVIGAGTNRLNIYTIRKATTGVGDYLLAHSDAPIAVISHDTRKNSRLFAEQTAAVLAQKGITVYLFPDACPTPMLSFAVRRLKADAGIMITASHNPAEYNGYKVYGRTGCQITQADAKEITSYIAEHNYFEKTSEKNFRDYVEEGCIRIIERELFDAYANAVNDLSLNNDIEYKDLKIIYTPLNGTGLMPVTRVLAENGFSDVTVVPEQKNPDQNFATCPFPNPEEKNALTLGIRMAEKLNADLVLGTDPDSDRVGAAIKSGNGYRLINGNEMGVLLFDYICAMLKHLGKMPKDPIAYKTIVTTDMAQLIAEDYGVKLQDLLTGFKYIGEQMDKLEENGEIGRFIFGFEESYGYLSGTHVRDKDAVNASLLICEMALQYQRMGMTLADRLEQLYQKHGYYCEDAQSIVLKGEEGAQKMKRVMQKMREEPPAQIAGIGIERMIDYATPQRTMEGGKLPASDVIRLFLRDHGTVTVRPSGTEPKLKLYYSVRADSKNEANRISRELQKAMPKLLGI